MRNWLLEGHLAWMVIDAVETLDPIALISAYRLGGRRRRAYDPAMMLTLLIDAYTHAGTCQMACVQDRL